MVQFRVSRSGTGALDRPGDHVPIPNAQKQLRRTGGDRTPTLLLLERKIRRIAGGIPPTKRKVDVRPIRAFGHDESLREVHLEDVPGCNVLHAPLDGGSVPVGRELGPGICFFRVRRAGGSLTGSDVGSAFGSIGRAQCFQHEVLGTAGPRRRSIERQRGEGPGSIEAVVDQQGVVQRQPEIRQ